VSVQCPSVVCDPTRDGFSLSVTSKFLPSVRQD